MYILIIIFFIVTIISNLMFLFIGLKVSKNEPIEIPKIEISKIKNSEHSDDNELETLMNNINNYPYNQKEVKE